MQKATRLGCAVPPGAQLHVGRRADAPQPAERHLADADADATGHLDLDALRRAVYCHREPASLLAPRDECAGVPLRKGRQN